MVEIEGRTVVGAGSTVLVPKMSRLSPGSPVPPPDIPREFRIRRDRIPRRIASWSLTIRIHVRRHLRLPRPATLREPLDPWPNLDKLDSHPFAGQVMGHITYSREVRVRI